MKRIDYLARILKARVYDVAAETPLHCWDGSQAAQKALSAILRTGQRFGVGHLIDVLHGVENEKTQRLGHDRLPTFGIGGELRYQSAKGTLPASENFAGPKIDLGGMNYLFNVSVRF